MRTIPRLIHFLLVESNPADAYLMVEGLRRAGLSENVTVLDDSEEALTYLDGGGRADVIFLDLNLTPMPGLDLLRRIRSHPKLELIPVVILSGSQNQEEIRNSYRLHANCFITKPGTLDEFLDCMKMCHDFWSKVVTLPSAES